MTTPPRQSTTTLKTNDNAMGNANVHLGRSVPRYTSYPTAPHFQAGIGVEIASDTYRTLSSSEPVSIYVHIPFCDKLCWFCGCNTKHTLRYEPIESYVTSLIAEIRLLRARLGRSITVANMHFGGGSPSMLRSGDAKRLGAALHEAFTITHHAEISIEIDPTDVAQNPDDAMLAFQHLGMTRASIGVQDFDEKVQKAINRPQSFETTRDVVNRLQDAGIASFNIDTLYGLPHQTINGVRKTMDQVISLQPDRVALFGYAHVPWVKKHQNMIPTEALPDTEERLDQAEAAALQLQAARYSLVGIDHFAKPDDCLAIAASAGRLRRNFQGYTTDQCDTLLGLGASSIGRSQFGFMQNAVATKAYKDAIARGELPLDKGYRLTTDDTIRAFMIEQLMCNLELRFDDMKERFGYLAQPYIAEARLAAANDEFHMTHADEDRLYIDDNARAFVRIIASQFDAYLADSKFKFSKAV
ncbi:MAG: oxygen-independent coproporphyrinogen III oxidase [Pseudomonadota bacterium]